ncbi:hypothetical protein [Novosphingobium malaysiense]|uniref:Lipoprotein n=1 Tax=Novosphingobium malaysiense TaxID=1348853 RepID=A0A0B1ZMY7_9SPHN|nr:hypothetical protein [Novosphingobium malaysiense]KHK92520.1 hypothetical protein LK12_06980 [Novosphingobium malaysiense]
MKAPTVLTFAMAIALALAGCQKDKAPDEADAAGGEILPRSVTDDMPPYDTVRSKAPPANPSTTPGGKAEAPDDSASQDSDDAAKDAGTDAPAQDDTVTQGAE